MIREIGRDAAWREDRAHERKLRGRRLDAYQGDCRGAILTLSAVSRPPESCRSRDMSQWFEAARVGEIANRKCKAVSLNGSAVALFNLDGEYFALEDVCTHLGRDISSGWVDGDRAVCPWHLAEFSIRTGEALKAPAYEGVHSFPVRVREGIIEVCDDRA